MLEEIWEKYQKQIIITGITVTIVVMFFCILVGAGRNDSTDKMIGNNLTSSSSSIQSSSNSATPMASGQDKETHAQRLASSKIMVDVKGAVKSPGVYEVKSGMRIMDAIEIAGGMTKSADQRNINLATQLSDQQVVYVPIKGEIKNSDPSQLSAVGSSSISSSSPSTTDSSTEKIVNINTASRAELLTLNGVGDKKAEQIINYREQQGEFKSIEDLKQVQGIGDKIFEGLQDAITV